MAGLQRSAETFRRSGSSGLVWEDRFSGNLNQDKDKDKDKNKEAAELKHSRSVGSTGMLERSLSNGGGRGYRTMGVEPTLDPPSPKVSGCGFCSAFGKSRKSKKSKPRNKRNK
ncbi:hypothetical protein J5N97_004046 [Dioscorea zingiberensis]|uniref:MAPK kinase substrate protein n=1 Tax=Dioscorea zingiberensis TaxID=325984 RepID=A0A9D5D7W6_9LILI|nr:hypothetical protein J5N97_004046 [Dioscorea zingiberensis]